MAVTCTGTCADCGKDFEIVPDRFDPPENVVPVGGVCPHCGSRLAWNPEDQYLAKFEPEGMMKTESPIAEITIRVSDDPVGD